MFENPRRGRQARNFTTNVPKILDLKSSSEQIFSENCRWCPCILCNMTFLSSGRCIILIFVLRLELNLESYCRLRYVQNYCLWTREGLWLHRLEILVKNRVTSLHTLTVKVELCNLTRMPTWDYSVESHYASPFFDSVLLSRAVQSNHEFFSLQN